MGEYGVPMMGEHGAELMDKHGVPMLGEHGVLIKKKDENGRGQCLTIHVG